MVHTSDDTQIPTPARDAGAPSSPAGEESFARPADFDPIVAYLRSCGGGAGSALAEPEEVAPRAGDLVRELTTQQRRRFAGCLAELGMLSLAVARRPGDPVPLPGPVLSRESWQRRFREVREEFEAADLGDGRRLRVIDRVDRELVLARDARGRARRCLRLALQLDPQSETIRLALLTLRAARHRGRATARRLGELARNARSAAVRARALACWAGLCAERGRDRRALDLLEESLALEPDEPQALARLAWCALRVDDATRAAEAIERLARTATTEADARLRSALAFLRAPSTRFARSLASSPEAARRLRGSTPALAVELLEAVQSRPRVRRRRAPRTAEEWLRRVRRRLDVPLAALVRRTGSGPFRVLAVQVASSTSFDGRAFASVCGRGGPGAVLERAAEDGDVVLARERDLAEDAGSGFHGLRGAAAAPVALPARPGTFLLVATARRMILDPEEIAAEAEDAGLYARSLPAPRRPARRPE